MKKVFIYTLISCFFLGGCAQNITPNSYPSSEIGVAKKAVPGIIVAKHCVNIDDHSGVGGLAGATAGAAAGAAVGGSSSVNVVGAVGGAVIGGLLGNALDIAVNKHDGIEYIIKLRNGSTISLMQVQKMQFDVGQHVLIVYGAMTHLIPVHLTTLKSS